jgi:hypothetical protein
MDLLEGPPGAGKGQDSQISDCTGSLVLTQSLGRYHCNQDGNRSGNDGVTLDSELLESRVSIFILSVWRHAWHILVKQ